MTRRRRLGVAEVRGVLDALAADQPARVDARADRGLAPRYVEHGEPACLAGAALHQLGVSLGVLRALDREARTSRDPGGGGVLLRHTGHGIRHRFTVAAWSLLCAVQETQDRGLPWRHVVDALLWPEGDWTTWWTNRYDLTQWKAPT